MADGIDRGAIARKAPLRTAGVWASSLPARLRAWSDAEAGRLALWTPVAIGAGALLYFSLKFEPSGWLGVVALVLAGGAAAMDAPRRAVWGSLLFVALGFAAADLRAALVDAPRLTRDLRPTEVVGTLVAVEEGAKLRRLIIDLDAIEGNDDALPRRARVSWRGAAFDALPGDRISLRAALGAPPPPVAPGAFDFARQLYFQEIGAVGYAVTAPVEIEGGRRTFLQRWRAAIEDMRLDLARRITSKTERNAAAGAIVAAFVTGKREAIPEEAEEALQRSGLAHLLAISGLHMGLATGLVFFGLRAMFAAFEPIARRYPIKKWAALGALAAGFLYLLLSGGGYSAQRACIMMSVIFFAILVDRRAFSLRNVAIAATIILLATPEAVMHPGFQMSFAAVTALIAAYEWHAQRPHPDRSYALADRARRYAWGVAATDTIASTATAPFGLYHFNYASLYSLPANLAAMPLMAVWVMPFAVIALILSPLGLDGWAWRVSAAGVDVILTVARYVSSLPHATQFMSQWPPAALGVITLGGLWLCLQSAPWRLAGLAALPVAALLILAARPPAILIDEEGDNAAIVAADGALAMFAPRRDRFAGRVWMEQIGRDPLAGVPIAMADIGRCDAAGCIVDTRGVVVSFLEDPMALAEDCARADLVIALFPLDRFNPPICATTLIQRRDIWEKGAHAVWIAKDGTLTIRTVNESRGARPWSD